MSGQHEQAVSRDVFDGFAFAERRLELTGTIDLRSLPRVADRLAEAEPAQLMWRITGAADALGRPALSLQLDGQVPLTCQRCLRAFTAAVTQQTLLLLARDEQDLARLDECDEHEVVLASAPLQARDLVEEEVLLTLPYVPRCVDSQCAVATSGVDVAVTPLESAFAALAALRPRSARGAVKKHRK